MLFFGVLATLLAVATAQSCYKQVEGACSGTEADTLLSSCNAKYGKINEHKIRLQSYANANIEASFMYLLMSTYFGNYKIQREGFKQLYRKQSDKTWEDAINVIKYLAKRGEGMNLKQPAQFKIISEETSQVVELNELHSLAKALNIQKQLADEAIKIHSLAHLDTMYDGAVSHYIEEQFLESHTERVRDLAGYTRDLKNLLVGHNPAVSVFLFDEYLKKSL